MKFHHIGVACKNIKDSILSYEEIGYESSELILDPIQNVELCFLKKADSPLIELVGVVDENSPLNNILKKNGTIPYHTCYEVTDIDAQIIDLSKKGYMLLSKPVEAIAFSNRRICFLYNRHIGIVELLEE
jgi:methylmalonyl-CoA/ethylmalonyl-CoA epimerase